jgi:hypothetical protein
MIAQPASDDERIRESEAVFDRSVRDHVTDRNAREFVAYDLDSGEFEVDADELAAADRLRRRLAEARVWLRRVGSPVAHRMGARRT